LIENNFTDIKKIYMSNFNLNKINKFLSEYEYLIYLDDNNNYDYKNLINDINNGLNIFESTKPIPNLFQSQSQSQSQLPIPTLPPSNIFDNKDMYITLLKLRNYGLMERGTLAEKALILIEQNIK
jgi:hypothetical protein